MDAIHLLFICSRNQWRSPTAEQVWSRVPGYQCRSAGTSPKAKRTVNASMLHWADVVFVMEKKHKTRLLAAYREAAEGTPVYVLDIPDVYDYMDAELIAELEDKVTAILADHAQ